MEIRSKDMFSVAITKFGTVGYAEVNEELQSLAAGQEFKKKLCMVFSTEERNFETFSITLLLVSISM